jgi:Asp-tRNA(Asn)/Glu-tRNA(Gln) amidotransferase A subunit family amidase
MYAWLDTFAARRRCREKQEQRAKAIEKAKETLKHEPAQVLPDELVEELRAEGIEAICARIARREFTATQLVKTFSQRALEAHDRFNCLTEIMIEDALEEAKRLDEALASKGPVGPMHGLPISIKDCINVAGYDSCIGCSLWTNSPISEDATIVQCLRRAGAIPYVKTNVPQAMLSFDCDNPVFGRTLNPVDQQFVVGGSSGGEAALLAAGGSLIGVGTDIGGSLRVPAHFTGIYSFKPTAERFPNEGQNTGNKGQESIKATTGPMGHDVQSLEFFMKTIIDQEPWLIDNACPPLPWRTWTPPKHLCFGYFTYPAAPACQRAVRVAVEALREAGHQVVEFTIPNPLEAMFVFNGLVGIDMENAELALLAGDPLIKQVATMKQMIQMPYFVRAILAWIMRYFYKEDKLATLLLTFTKKTHAEVRSYVCRRNAYRNLFAKTARAVALEKCGQTFDAIIAPDFGFPAMSLKAISAVLPLTSYITLQNLLDVPTGTMPVTKVDRDLDKQTEGVSWLGPDARIGFVEKMCRQHYDPDQMHGLPVGIQVFGERFQDEKVLGCMRVVDECIKRYKSKPATKA